MTTMTGHAAGPPAGASSPAPRPGGGGEAEAFAALLAGVLVTGMDASPRAIPRAGLGLQGERGADVPEEAMPQSREGDGGPDGVPHPSQGAGSGESVDPRALLLRAGGWSTGGTGGVGHPGGATSARVGRPQERAPGLSGGGPSDVGAGESPAEGAQADEPREPAGAGEAARFASRYAGSASVAPGAAAASGVEPPALTSVSAPNRDPDRMDPRFRQRLDRVVERLEAEHGIQVRLLEGFRPQLRQEHLYAQGRTAPGPVVTWTLNSAHTDGRAADLKLDGGEESYRLMHRIAGEEGLRTLGMKDPGHLELPREPGEGPAVARMRADSGPAPSPTAYGPGGVARIARVARVASAAVPGSPARAGAQGVSAPEGRQAPEPIPAPLVSVDGQQDTPTVQASWEGSASTPATDTSTGVGAARPVVAEAPGARAADRVAEVEALRDSAAPGPVRRVEIRDADGQGTRVRIELRGDTVRTDIRTADPELARRLQPAAAELEGALEQHGLELGRLRVARIPEGAGALQGNSHPGGGRSDEEGWGSGQERRHADRDPSEQQGRQRPRHGGGKEEGS